MVSLTFRPRDLDLLVNAQRVLKCECLPARVSVNADRLATYWLRMVPVVVKRSVQL